MNKSRKRFSFFIVFALIMQMLTPLSNANEIYPILSDETHISISEQVNAIELEDESQLSSIFEINSMETGQKVNAQGIVLTNQGLFDEDEEDRSFYIMDENSSDVIKAKTNEYFDIKVGNNIKFSAYLGNDEENELQVENITTMSILRVSAPIVRNYLPKKIGELGKDDNKSLISLENVKIKKITKPNKNHKNLNIIVYDEDGELKLSANIKETGITYDKLKQKVDEKDKINVKGFYVKEKDYSVLYIYSIDDIELVEKFELSKEKYQPLTIAQIQGEGHETKYQNKTVMLEDVVVTRISKSTEFFVQSLTPDDNYKTSEGIKIYLNRNKEKIKDLEVGDKVKIKGLVEEKAGEGFSDESKKGLPITMITAHEIEKDGKASLPEPVKIYDKMPKTHIDNDSLTEFQPEEDAIDYLESLEGMLVEVEKPKVVAPFKNKELFVVPKTYNDLNYFGAVNIDEKRYNLNVFCLNIPNGIKVKDDEEETEKRNTLRPGDFFTENITGTVDYGYSKYRISMSADELYKAKKGEKITDTSSLLPEKDKLLIASYNIENFSANTEKTKDEKVQKIASSIVTQLKNPDIITVIEMQDNNGSEEGGVDASESARRLSNAIKENGGQEYNYIDIPPVNNQDGGAPNSNIRLGFFYNPKRVKLKEKKKGDATTEGIYTKGEGFNFNPVRVSPNSDAFIRTRKSLAGEFVFNGQDVIVISNHLSSKRGELPLFGKTQPVSFESEVKRLKQVEEIKNFVNKIQNENSNAKIVLTGDFNDFEFSRTLQNMVSDKKLVNLVETYPENERFAYSYNGLAQCLDHILVSKNIENKAKLDIVNINSMFTEEDGRASDHDPLVVQLDLSEKVEEDKPNKPEDDKKEEDQEKPKEDGNKPSEEPKKPEVDGNEPSEEPKKPEVEEPKLPEKPEMPKVEEGYKTVKELKDLKINSKFDKAELLVAVSHNKLDNRIYFTDEGSSVCILGNATADAKTFEIGDKVQIKGKKTKTGLSDIRILKVKEKNLPLTFSTKTIEEIKDGNLDLNLIKLENVKIDSISKEKNEAIIKVSDEKNNKVNISIRLDKGNSFEDINKKVKVDDKVNIKGLYFEKNKKLKPFSPDHIELVKKEEKEEIQEEMIEKIRLKAIVKFIASYNIDGKTATLILYKDGKEIERREVKGNSTEEFSNLDKTAKDKKPFKYEIKQINLEDFELKVEVKENEYIFTNTEKSTSEKEKEPEAGNKPDTGKKPEKENKPEAENKPKTETKPDAENKKEKTPQVENKGQDEKSSRGASSTGSSRDNYKEDIRINRVLAAQGENTVTVTDEEVAKGGSQKEYKFEDIKNHWAKKSIESAVEKGYFAGTTDDTFSPNYNITRAQFVTVIGRMSKVTKKSKANYFKDTKADAYYSIYLDWAMENNLIKGYDDKTFRPNHYITREEVSVILAKYLKDNEMKTKELDFTDKEKISKWALDSVKSIAGLEILKGRTDNTFGGKDPLTRAEMAQIINNIEKLLNK